MGIVTAVGISANSEKHGPEAAKRLEQAMSIAVQACVDEGLQAGREEDARLIRQRMQDAHDRVLADISEGR